MTQAPAASLFIAFVFFVVAVGCGGGGGGGGGTPPSDTGGDVGVDADETRTDTSQGEDTDQERDTNREPNQADRVLEPGGTAVTEAVGFGAAQGAFENPIAVSAETADDPTAEAPLPPEAGAVGDFVEIAAGRDVDIAAGEPPLYLVLPVPADVEASNLALAVLSGGDEMAGDKVPADARVWSVVSGMYDSSHNLFVVPLRFLVAGGTTVTLVESDEYDAPSLSGSSESGGSEWQGGLLEGEDPAAAVGAAVDAATSHLESGSKQDDFYIVCRGFDGDGCGSAEKEAVRTHLKSAESDFSSGFRKPALRRTLPGRTVDGTEGRFYLYVLRPQESERPCLDGDGAYAPLTRVGVTCHDPSSEDSPSEATTRMEYVHAVQYAYPFFDRYRSGASQSAWLLEGPAAFAKNAETTAANAVRWDRASSSDDLRKVDKALAARTGQPPYPAAGTQDFWVYLINRRNSSPEDVFVPLWESATDGAPSASNVNARYDLTGAHWGWVRNQAVEAHEVGGNSDLNGTCVPDSNAWESTHRTVTYDVTSQSALSDQVELEGDWRAGVVKVEVDNPSGEKVKAVVSGASESGYMKAYSARNSPEKHCLRRNERPSSTKVSSVIEAGQTWVSYLLLSNSTQSFSEKRSYNVVVSAVEQTSDQESPSVAIERPPAVDYPLKRDTLFLKADASDPGGGFIEVLEWTVEGSGGTTKTYRGDDLAIEDFWSDGFQAGTFTIEVYAKDDDGQEVTLTLQTEIEQK